MFSFRTTPLQEQLDKALVDGKVGCFCTQNCWDTASGQYMYDIFRQRGNLQTVFSPRDTELTPLTNHIEFTPDELLGLNAIVVEIQDVGVRYFNYTKDVMALMETLRDLGDNAPSLYIVDHVNPAGRLWKVPCLKETVNPTLRRYHIATDSHLVNSPCSITRNSAQSMPCT